MPGPQGILEKGVVILRTLQHTDSSLGQEGITGGEIGFCDDQDLFVSGQIQGAVQAADPAAHDQNIGFHCQLSLP